MESKKKEKGKKKEGKREKGGERHIPSPSGAFAACSGKYDEENTPEGKGGRKEGRKEGDLPRLWPRQGAGRRVEKPP